MANGKVLRPITYSSSSQDDVTMDSDSVIDDCCGEAHTCQSEVSWLNFYKAILADDAETVRQAIKHRDYRIQIEDGKSAFELAVKLGSVNAVKVMVEDLRKEHDSYEQYRVLVHGCFSACKGQQGELLTILLESTMREELKEWHEAIHFLGIYEKAVENSSLALMDIVESFTEIDKKEIAVIRRAFINGRRDIFQRLFEVGERTADELANELPVPVLLIHIALGNKEQVRSEIEIVRNWWIGVPFGDDGNGNTTTELNAFGVAGNFCDIDILDLLYSKAQDCVPDLESILEKDYKHAMFHDGVEVVQWLLERGICDMKMPYEVDVECSHCYPHIDPKGRVFQYLESKCKDVRLSEEAKMDKVMKVIYDVVAHGSEVLIDWYLGQVPMNPTLALVCLKAAVAFDRPYFVERFMKQVDFDCDDPHDTVHEVLRFMYQCNKKRNRRLPSPAVTELVLSKMSRGSTCKCGECVLFDLFLDMDYAGGHSHRGEDLLPFNVTCRHIRILITQMVTRGARPKLKTIKRALFNFLSNTGASSLETCFGARVIWLFDWYDISQLLKPFKIDQCAIWFIRKFEDRDAILSELLQSLCGVKEPKLQWDGLLVYVLNPNRRRRQFMKCIHEFGLTISDKYMAKVSDELKKTPAYKEVCELTKPRMLSLQSLARLQIYRELREKTSLFRKTHDDFVPLCETVSIWCETKGLPRPMRDFMNFKDCFDQWSDNIEPHIHESVRDLVFDVSEVLFLHPQLRNSTEEDDE